MSREVVVVYVLSYSLGLTTSMHNITLIYMILYSTDTSGKRERQRDKQKDRQTDRRY